MAVLDRRLLSDNTDVADDGMLTVGGCRIDGGLNCGESVWACACWINEKGRHRGAP